MRKFIQLGIVTWRHWREISVVYLTQCILGLVVASMFYLEFSERMNKSMVLEELAKGFDRTVFTDLFNSGDAILGTTKMVGIGLLVAYLLISIVLQGGWLANIRKKESNISSLFSHGMKFFGPFLGIGVVSVFLVAFMGGLVGFIFTITVGDPLVTFSSEKPYVIWIVCLLILFIFWSTLIWAWSVISRCYFVDGNSFTASLKLGFHTLRKKWITFQAIGMLIVAFHMLLMLLYYLIMGDRGASSWFIVLGGILVQQVFNFLRIVLRGFGYALVEELI